MAYGAKTYTLREESTESGTRYSISFKDGQGGNHTYALTLLQIHEIHGILKKGEFLWIQMI